MLAYDDRGTGDPIVLLHGLAADRGIWRHVDGLLPGFRRIAVDVPGFGASPAAGEGFELERVARAVLDGLPPIGRFTLVGHSMGGAVALTAATLAPERIERLVLCAPAGLRPLPAAATPALGAMGEWAVRLRRRGAPLAATPAGRRVLMAAGTAPGDAVGADDVTAMVCASAGATRIAEALAEVTRVDLRPRLAAAPPRLGLIWGSVDRVIPLRTAGAVLAERPDAVLEVIPRAGHITMMERPRAFASMLRQVVAKVDEVHS